MLFNKKELKLLGEFAGDYHGKVYGRDISKRLEMNQKTVSNILNALEKEDVLKSVYEGRNKQYYLNSFNPHLKEILKIIEINRKVVFLESHKKIKGLFEKLERRVIGILVIFGSYAKCSETKKSDLDVFVIGQIGEVEELEEIWKVKINIVKSTKGKFSKDEHFIKEVIKNHVVLKGVEDFIELVW